MFMLNLGRKIKQLLLSRLFKVGFTLVAQLSLISLRSLISGKQLAVSMRRITVIEVDTAILCMLRLLEES